MKKQFFCITLCCAFSILAHAQDPAWIWANNNGGGANDFAYGSAFDKSGNVYYCGSFYSNNAKFGAATFTSSGLGDGFVCKYDPDGNFLWVKIIGGPETEACQKVAVNDRGDVFVTGYSEGDFNADSVSFISNGEADCFVAKYNSSGILQWIRRFGGEGDDYSYSLALDTNGRCVVTGVFEHSITIGNFVLTSQNDSLYDAFVAKFDKKGNVLWASQAGGSVFNSYVYPTDVTVDMAGNVFMTGTYTGPASFGDHTLYAQEEVFIAKLSKSGVFKWAVDAGSRCYYAFIATDAASNIYVAGSYGAYGYPSQIGNFTLATNGPYMDVFLAKFNSTGIVQTIQTGGSNKNDYAGGLAVDPSGNAWISGYVQGNTATFGSKSFASKGKADVFVTSYDAAGNVKWLIQAAGNNEDHAFDLAYDGNNYLAIAGTFKNKITLGSITLNSSSISSDAFVAKIGINGSMKFNAESVKAGMVIYPNPVMDFLKIESGISGPQYLRILTLDGRMMMEKNMVMTDANEGTLDISLLPPGCYLLIVNSDGNQSVRKFMKQ
ncbi:MAG: T9SS type A sorting domain-containing protein [Chitinophagales bacterium]